MSNRIQKIRDELEARAVHLQEEISKLQEELDRTKDDLRAVTDYITFLDTVSPI